MKKSFDLTVEAMPAFAEQGVQNYLCVKYFSGDAGRKFTVLADDQVLASVMLENRRNS